MKKKTDSKPLSAAAKKKPTAANLKSAPAKPPRKRGKRGLKPSQRIKRAKELEAVEAAKTKGAASENRGSGDGPRIVPGEALAGMLTQEENGVAERADARLLRRAVRLRWEGSGPEVNSLLRKRAERFAASANTISEFQPAMSLILQMERQNQIDQVAALQAINDQERLDADLALQRELRELAADANRRPEFFDGLHPVEGRPLPASAREPRRAGARRQPGGVEVISAPRDGEP